MDDYSEVQIDEVLGQPRGARNSDVISCIFPARHTWLSHMTGAPRPGYPGFMVLVVELEMSKYLIPRELRIL